MGSACSFNAGFALCRRSNVDHIRSAQMNTADAAIVLSNVDRSLFP